MRFVLVFALTACAVISAGSAAPETGVKPGVARVWFLFLSDLAPSYDTGATPTIYVNGRALNTIRGGTAFFCDFAAGTYQFSVDPYGTSTGDVRQVQLVPGSQTFLQVQYSRTWEHGYTGGWGMTAYSFFIEPMSPQVAQAYLPTMTLLGSR